jgi:hypothetical protein
MSCADGKGSPHASMAQRQAFRRQALDLLSADLAALAKLASSDREFVHLTLRHWLADDALESTRPPRGRPICPPTNGGAGRGSGRGSNR